MKWKTITLALAVAIVNIGPAEAQNQKPSEPQKTERERFAELAKKRIAELQERIKETEDDLKFVQENNTKHPDFSKQVAHLQQKIDNLKGQLATYKGELIKDPPSNPNSGSEGNTKPNVGGMDQIPGELSRVFSAIELHTQKKLNVQQLKFYCRIKAESIARLPHAVAFGIKRELNLDEDKPLIPEAVPDKRFIEMQRIYYDRYYASGRSLNAELEQTDYYMQGGKKVDAPGLRVLKVKRRVTVYEDDDSDKRVDKYEEVLQYPNTASGAAPELWPMLFDGTP